MVIGTQGGGGGRLAGAAVVRLAASLAWPAGKLRTRGGEAAHRNDPGVVGVCLASLVRSGVLLRVPGGVANHRVDRAPLSGFSCPSAR
jgi:hypothetical protein